MDFNFKFGEMTLYERKKLYDIILDLKPNIILECGSGIGASTHIMVNATPKYSKIFSCDPVRTPVVNSEKLEFNKVKSDVLISKIINDNIIPDVIFFDGPEDPEVALNDFKNLDKYVGDGTVFLMHDWCTITRKFDGGISTKALLLKPYINKLDNWELVEEIFGDDYKEGEESVGLCYYKKTVK